MAADPRRLRARWTIATIGWLLGAVSLPLPLVRSDRVWMVYRNIVQMIYQGHVWPRSAKDAIEVAAMCGFVLATCVMAVSPVLVQLNASSRPSIRRWRWMGLGLLAMAQLSVVAFVPPAPWSVWTVHFLVLAHVIVGIAILPWPRERVLKQSGFDVLIPVDQQSRD